MMPGANVLQTASDAMKAWQVISRADKRKGRTVPKVGALTGTGSLMWCTDRLIP